MNYTFLKEPVPSVDREKIAAAIQELEGKYHMTFPQTFREYAMACDRAKIKLQQLLVNGYSCEVFQIVPICGEGLTFAGVVENDRQDGFISPHFYPLASDRGGDYYYWDDETGKVYLVRSDDVDTPFEVSASVRDFFALFH